MEEGHPASLLVPNFFEWSSNSNDATLLGLVEEQKGNIDSTDPIVSKTFRPSFTHAIFGMHETIFGYKDLNIKIEFASGSLRPYLQVDYSEKYTPNTSSPILKLITADNIQDLLSDVLPKGYLTDRDSFIDAVKSDAKTFKPLGEKIAEYTREEDGILQNFEIFKNSFTSEKFREYHARMQPFILFFIEAGSYINEDERWEIYTTFKRQDDIYHFIGYCTTYPFFCWPESIRMRISQFIVLPPYKKQGHGSKLYQTIYELFKSRQEIIEITVEDAGDEFAEMRDKNDYRYLLQHGAFEGLKAPISNDIFNTLQKEFKLTNRQTRRCVEIYLLSRLNKLDEGEYKAYRLQVKERLYRVNSEKLREIEQSERKEILQQTYLGIEEEYHELLELMH